MLKLNVLVAGSTGYIGIQLVNLLVKHKKIKIKYLCGNSSVGKSISYFDKSIKSKLPNITKITKDKINSCDIIFSALPNGEAQSISKLLNNNNILIDLSADFRLKKFKDYFKWYKINHKAKKNIKKSIYALPEISKEKIKKFQIISCPGCYPTSILLPLIPLLKKKIINKNNIIVDSKSGYSGAGRNVHKKFKGKNLYESLSAYGVGFHRHNSEVIQELNNYAKNVKLYFTPHLTPMFRGILSTIYVDLSKSINQNKVINTLKKFYINSKFVKISNQNVPLSTNNVINTNKCIISVCKTNYKNKLIILSAIDNLIKGGSGQAIQNMNIRFNFKENEGLV